MTRPPLRAAHGFSLVETALATVVVATLLVATLNGVGSVAFSRAQTSEQGVGLALAQRLLDEMLTLPYNDPQSGTCPLAPGAGEITGTRSLFDNVGDYAGWTETSPKDKAGAAIPGVPAWGRSVTMTYITPATPATASGTDKGAVLITVKIKRGNRTVATLRTIRARSFEASVLNPPNSSGTRTTANAASFGAAQ